MNENPALNNHGQFNELAALANSGTLTASEWAQLRDHLQICEECRDVYQQYLLLACEGIPLLAPRYAKQDRREAWDEVAAWRKLVARIHSTKQQDCVEPASPLQEMFRPNLLRRPLARVALAACLVMATGLVAYRLEIRTESVAKPAGASAENPLPKLVAKKDGAVDEESLRRDAKRIVELQEAVSQSEQELAKLRPILRTLKSRADELVTANSALDEQLLTLSEQRDDLSSQLRDAERAYQEAKSELAKLHSERDNESLRKASLESRIDELSAATRDQVRRLKDDEQYLASDRDIRELMGARKLYIADVFDVDSRSRTRKPFGRVFYTNGKSLIFYAFDLDREQDMNNASAFQAWGRKETDLEKPLNLGIFYIDSVSSRRWVLRFDDPKQLAEINAVFVTVEPHGGSRKPTGKPFLYALLPKEANHP
jgi:hypothetical protein